jgi:predicted ribosome quality control (RQC) complex YloA/Tae2 family protein
VLIRSSMPIPFERLVRLDFGSHPDTKPELSLICEIQGQYSNVIMVDADENVVLAARQVGRAMLCTLVPGPTGRLGPTRGCAFECLDRLTFAAVE